MSAGPKDATLSGDGFRFYRWTDAATDEPTDVLSVTSIRKLCGEPYTLVNWQLANLADAALGTMKRVVVGPRGGISEKRLIQEYPCEFAQLYDAASVGELGTPAQSKIDELRRWLDHVPQRSEEFRARYRAEHVEPLAKLRGLAANGRVTVVYAGRDREHNNAAVLAEFLRDG